MKIETKFLGEVEINEEEIINFEFGLPGFPEQQQFVLLPIEENLPLALLQSTIQAQIGFVVAYPFAFKNDYEFDLSEEDLEDLRIENPEQIVTYSIVTLKESLSESTLNLLAPIIINMKKKSGKQIVLLDNEKYSLRYPMGTLEGSAK